MEYIKESDDGRSLLIGSLTRHHALESSPLARKRVPLLSETAGLDRRPSGPEPRHHRRRAGPLRPERRLGGCRSRAAGQVEILGQSGERTISIDDFLVDTFTTALKEDELITQVAVPIPPEGGSGGAYLKLERKAGDFATVGVAAQLALEGADGGHCTYAGIGLTAVGAKNLRASEAEACLVGRKLTKEAIAAASTAAAEECAPTDDPLRGSAKYKREMAGLFTRRALELAASRAWGQRGSGAR